VPFRQRDAHAERVEQFQPDASRCIQCFPDVSFQRFESARRPCGRLALFRAQRETGADRKDLWTEPKQRSCVVGDERANLFDLCVALENVDLIDHDDDLLAPPADLFEKRALGFGEWPIGGGHEQHQV
jgi:hypothetical protein